MFADRTRMREQEYSADSGSAFSGASHNSEPVLRIRLLGHFRVSADSRVISEQAWRLRKAGHLIKLLALAPGHRLHREQVLDRLWPELSPGAAGNNLRVTLHAARRTLEPEPVGGPNLLRLESSQLIFSPSTTVWVDVTAFEAAAARARGSNNPNAYHAALDLYGGDLLPDDPYEDWAIARRESLWALQLELRADLAALYERRGESDLAIDMLRRILASDPVREEAHTGLMRLYAKLGRRHQALHQYRLLEAVLRRELSIGPDVASRRLYDDIANNRFSSSSVGPTLIPETRPQRAGPVPPTQEQPPTNLPVQLTSFIGRDWEITELVRLLADRRLITLTGPGGSGKTRLALQVAGKLVEEYVDGVWLSDLAVLSDPGLVPQVVASSLGIREESEATMVHTLAKFLADKRLMLVLDNCEHLAATCAILVERLLRTAPELHVLATSREPLRVPGEMVRPVPSLAVAESQGQPSLERLRRSDAVRLFAERVQLHQPDFVVNQNNARLVSRICLGLDGMPLAIELAAARTWMLPLEQIAARLDESLRLFSSGSRTAPARHQTLRAAIDWSWNLLSDREQQLLRRLSIFSGGCATDAAERICAGDGITSGDVLGLVFQLVDKSLVLVEELNGEARYRLLETIRQYALEQLEADDDATELRLRHATYFSALAEQGLPELRGPNATIWVERFTQEYDNMRAALTFLLESDNAAYGLHLGWALWRFWSTRGYLTEGRRWLARLLDLEMAPKAREPRMKALFGAGRLAFLQADYAGARPAFDESLTIARECGDRDYIAGSLIQLGYVSLREGDYTVARTCFEDGLAIRRELGEGWYIAVAVVGLGQTALARRDYEEASTLFQEGLTLYRAAGDRMQVARPLNLLGQLAYYQGFYDRARVLLERSLTIWRTAGYKRGMAMAFAGLGHVAAAQDDDRRARAMFEASRTLYHDLGVRRAIADALESFVWPPDESDPDTRSNAP